MVVVQLECRSSDGDSSERNGLGTGNAQEWWEKEKDTCISVVNSSTGTISFDIHQQQRHLSGHVISGLVYWTVSQPVTWLNS